MTLLISVCFNLQNSHIMWCDQYNDGGDDDEELKGNSLAMGFTVI